MISPDHVLHLAPLAAWVEAKKTGTYRADSLDSEGFMHASTKDQVLATAQRYYQGRTDLMLLVIDPDQTSGEWKWERSANVGEDFPHLYGELEVDAVVAWAPFNPGHSELPPGI